MSYSLDSYNLEVPAQAKKVLNLEVLSLDVPAQVEKVLNQSNFPAQAGQAFCLTV